MDSNLFKEAIADAKAVRQTALANAKVALEEAFTERYKAMFAEKLKEEAEMDEAPHAEEEGSAAPAGASEENVSEQEIDELIRELEAEVGGEQPHPEPDGDEAGAVPPAPMGAPPMGAGAPPVPGAVPPGCPPPVPGAAPLGAPPMGGAPMGMPPVGAPPVPGAEVAPVAPPGVEAAPVAPAGVEAAPEAGAEGGTPPPSDVPPTGAEEDEEFDLNELLESLKAEIGENYEEGKKEEEEEEEEEEEGKKLDEQTKLQSSGIGGSKAGGSPNKQPAAAAKNSSKIESAAQDKEGYASTDQAKVVAKEATQAARPNKAQHATKDNLSTPSFGGKGGNGSGGQTEDGYPSTDNAKSTAKEPTQAKRPNQASNATKDNLSTPGGMLEENKALKKQINEAEEVIRYVKGQLNEVNLLNAKLLYTNKLFKEFNMNNEQKMRVVEMFDLSKNVREVKLTYANIAESLNFGGTDIKRKAKAPTSVQAITEGLASGAVASTKPSKVIISEGKFAARMKQLAGIRGEQKK
jgi:hypothetical protein